MNKLFYKDQKLIESDDSQWKAYNSTSNTVVIAGPGSGKTRVLTLKAIKLIQSDIHSPSGLACISYSRETVRELRKRLKEYGYQRSQYDFIGTMHGFCLIHILQPFGHLFPEYNIPVPLKIASNDLIRQIYNGVLAELEVEQIAISITDINKQRSLSFNGSSEVQIQTNAFEVQAAELFEKKLIETGTVDFISMVNISTKMIKEQDYIKKTLEARFPWILIDEYQDLGKALHEIVLELKTQTGAKIFAVGDMNQSIYGFNGAYPDFLVELDTMEDFESIPLTSNYRSNQDIIEGSIDTLALKPPRLKYDAKKRIDESAQLTFITCEAERQEQYEVVTKKIIPKLIKKGISYEDIGILVGSNSFFSPEVTEMAAVLKDDNIPFFIVKWTFSNTDIVFWLQDCAQWCLDKTKQSFDELFKFWYYQLELHNDTKFLWEEIRLKSLFHEVLTESKLTLNVLSWLEFIFYKLSLRDMLVDSIRYPDENHNLDLLLDEAKNKNLKESSLKRFAYLGEPENEITVTTRHSSKGLEFEVVILLGMEEGRFPYFNIEDGSRQMEEAHRLCYVCISRAKSECILLRSKKITLNTRNGPWLKDYNPSRFWNILIERFGNEKNTFDSNNY
ncbi:UvrD-helicase domain-containing protein [Maribacter dokdonensis]|uniref:UvrD-helicase domain-containing protein n=1 Tax=Maribacter dokdonensis TaxID=320912 RepID=UPI001C099426|nr:ATP-dependent helicase [Maribacter dokdonensis]MBU2902612.1 ATP-dependent helicase [Maribacter dokdonensis]